MSSPDTSTCLIATILDLMIFYSNEVISFLYNINLAIRIFAVTQAEAWLLVDPTEGDLSDSSYKKY